MKTATSSITLKPGTRILLNLARIIVGLLFIFSGLVKANDPLGLSYKMQEFFEIWGVNQFNSYTLAISVVVNAFEIIAGFALLIGWQVRLFSWLLLLLIVFFTFLTGYTYVTGKPTNCGCFGDCLLISSKASFLKDVALTVLIAFIFFHRRRIQPLLTDKLSWVAMLLVTVFSFGLQWYSLNYLPPVDCLPFKKGNNLEEKMKMPANAIKDSTVITYIYEKNGQKIEFTADKFPTDFGESYKFISRYDKIVRKGSNNIAPIHGFKLYGEDKNIDSAEVVLKEPYALLLFLEDFSTSFSKWQKDFTDVYKAARQKNIPIYVVTSARDQVIKTFNSAGLTGIPVFTCDYTAIRTAARTNPSLYLLQQGTVIEKLSYRRMRSMLDRIGTITPVPPPIIAPVPENDTLPITPGTTQQQ